MTQHKGKDASIQLAYVNIIFTTNVGIWLIKFVGINNIIFSLGSLLI